MQQDCNLEMLMARYQEGDLVAATALVECAAPNLYRFFLAQAESRADAEDLLQETWLRIHKVRHTHRPGEPVLPWLYAIARHIRIDHYRKSMRTVVGVRELETMSQETVSAAGHMDRADDLEALLAPLSASEREVVEMLKVAGMSLEEVARATSSSVGSVKQKAHRAYKKLRERMTAVAFGGRQSRGAS